MSMATGRQRHEEKVAFYCDTDMVIAITDALSKLRARGIKVDRGRFIREAVAYVFDLSPEAKETFAQRLSEGPAF